MRVRNNTNFYIAKQFLVYNFRMNIINFKKIDSTNKYAKENIENLADKTIISTDVQTNGYGRFERNWVDLGTENIYMTFVLKPSDDLKEVYANLTQYLSVCLCKQLEELNLSPQIKWPNDVLINDKKVCGILAETVIKGEKLKGIVLGIGINLKASQNDLSSIDRPATSLNLESGLNINKQEFMQSLIERFFKDYEEFLKIGFGFIKKDYEKYASFSTLYAAPLKIAIFNTVKEGAFEGFDDNGNLILRMPDGHVENINMGEII